MSKTKENLELDLLNATEENNKDRISLLLKAGVDINCVDKLKNTPLHIACHNGYTDIVKLLLAEKNICIHKINSNDFTPLFLACRVGKIEIVKQLLLKGAHVNCSSIRALNGKIIYCTPLYISCYHNHKDVVAFLLENGAKVSLPNRHNRVLNPSLLHLALENDNSDIFQMLLNYGHNFRNTCSDRDSLLHLACDKGNTKIVQALLDAGAKIHIKNSVGITPLQIATEKGYGEIVSMLNNCARNFFVNMFAKLDMFFFTTPPDLPTAAKNYNSVYLPKVLSDSIHIR